ncbi:unnamed protein product [Cylicocyclus nassatus]|uniref:Uncharacterized protein n=1 Tax=Cylicocyclus nassatus TaxID=53992 RepID=A0AA36GZL6_CYLNA|nr:unnamed protein product [Cylicocyclus nassatus]
MRFSKLLLLIICSFSTETAQTDKAATGHKAGLEMNNGTPTTTLIEFADAQKKEVSAKHGGKSDYANSQQMREEEALSGIELEKRRQSLKHGQRVQETKQSFEDKSIESIKDSGLSKIEERKLKASDLVVTKDGRNEIYKRHHEVHESQKARARRAESNYPYEEAPWAYQGKSLEKTGKKNIMSSPIDVKNRFGKGNRKKPMKSVSANGDRDFLKQKAPKKKLSSRRLSKKKKFDSGKKQHSTKPSTDDDKEERQLIHSGFGKDSDYDVSVKTAELQENGESRTGNNFASRLLKGRQKELATKETLHGKTSSYVVNKIDSANAKSARSNSVRLYGDGQLKSVKGPLMTNRSDVKRSSYWSNPWTIKYERKKLEALEKLLSRDKPRRESERSRVRGHRGVEVPPWQWKETPETTSEELPTPIETTEPPEAPGETEPPPVIKIKTKKPLNQVETTKWVDPFRRAPWEYRKNLPPRITHVGGNEWGYRRRKKREIYYGPRLKFFQERVWSMPYERHWDPSDSEQPWKSRNIWWRYFAQGENLT